MASLQVAFGDRPLRWRRRIFWASIRHTSYILVEAIVQPKLLSDANVRRRLDISEVNAAFEEAGVFERCGGLVVGSHLGNSDLLGTVAASHGWVAASAVRMLDNPRIAATMFADRRQFGHDMIPKKGYLQSALRRLRQKGLASILIDQDMGSGGIFVPFFGVPASTTGSAAGLALRTGQPAFMVFFIRQRERRPDQRAYCYRLDFQPSGDRTADIQAFTAQATAEIESFCRRFPEQMLWAHRRWKSRPPEEVSPR